MGGWGHNLYHILNVDEMVCIAYVCVHSLHKCTKLYFIRIELQRTVMSYLMHLLLHISHRLLVITKQLPYLLPISVDVLLLLSAR